MVKGLRGIDLEDLFRASALGLNLSTTKATGPLTS